MTYSLAGQAIAVRVRELDGGGTEVSNELYYLHSDHLGNASAMSDGDGDLVPGSTARYLPFGDWRTEPTTNPDITDRGFTGHRHNNSGGNDLGLIYMNARYYVSGIARFASADTIVPNLANPQSLNRYSYSRNNPINRVDPTGHRDCEFDDYCGPPSKAPTQPIVYHDYEHPVLKSIVENTLQLPFTVSVAIMPSNSNVAPEGAQLPEEVKLASAGLGVLADEAEFLLIIIPFDGVSGGEFLVAGFDATFSGLNCYAVGECYVGQPHPSLPLMTVVNQDVLVNVGDFSVSWTVLLDGLTTTSSLIYDTIDAGGGMPNIISIGFTPDLTLDPRPVRVFILVYPDGGTEWNPEHWTHKK